MGNENELRNQNLKKVVKTKVQLASWKQTVNHKVAKKCVLLVQGIWSQKPR